MRHPRLPTAPSILLASFALIGSTGCAFEGEPPGALDAIAFESTCPDTGCGTNGSFVDGWAIGELDEGPSSSALAAMPYDESLEQSREDNVAGVRLLHLRKGANYYRADVQGRRLVALDHNGVVQLSAQDLEGSALVVELPDGETAYAHIVESRRDLPFWISPDDMIEAFHIRWSYFPSYQASTAQDVCPPGPGDEADDETYYYATFFQGDRYDGDLKQVIATGHEAGTWFNVACFKSVASKMLFNRHAEAGLKDGYKATRDQKQAFIKMLTADFCGQGQSFTETGTKLDWTNSLGWQMLNPKAHYTYEAVWGPDGALCLDNARLDNERAIRDVCELPECAQLIEKFPTGWDEEGYLLSASP